MSDEDRYDDVYHSTFDSTGGRENSLCWSSITENVQFVDSNSSNETLSMQSNKLPSPPSGESGKDGYTEDESTEDYSSAESVRSMSKVKEKQILNLPPVFQTVFPVFSNL